MDAKGGRITAHAGMLATTVLVGITRRHLETSVATSLGNHLPPRHLRVPCCGLGQVSSLLRVSLSSFCKRGPGRTRPSSLAPLGRAHVVEDKELRTCSVTLNLGSEST